MSDLSIELTITSIINRGKIGGVIMAGNSPDGLRYVAQCNWQLIPDSSFPSKGQRWLVSGPVEVKKVFVNGYARHEHQIKAQKAEILRPSGQNLITWITENPEIKGVGQVKARKLYERFGPDLLELIEQRDIPALTTIITEESAQLICHAFEQHNVGEVLLWLDQMGIIRSIGQKVISCYGVQARDKVESNPYLLISFEAKWKIVDGLAMNRFGISENDRRRLEAAVEEALYRGLSNGHTCLPESNLRQAVKRLLLKKDLVDQALSLGDSTQYCKVSDRYQPAGTYIIEHQVAQRLHEIIEGENAPQGSIFQTGAPSQEDVDSAIAQYEQAQGFELSLEQKQAVQRSVTSKASLILGGAGTGKTTVLKALYEAIEAVSSNTTAIYQVALAGRAAKRMSEATGRDSMTIAAFLHSVEETMLGEGSLVVVDEVSMVDVILFYRLLAHIPPGTRLVLVGDPSQLPPIGPGLVLHALAGHPSIPQTELKVVKRQSEASGIPLAASAVRSHQVPTFAEFEGRGNGVSMVECPENSLDQTVQAIYLQLGGIGTDYSVQILSTTRSGNGGIQHINQLFRDGLQSSAETVYAFNQEFGVVQGMTLDRVLLSVGDLVMFTKNDYTIDLRNGSLGRIVSSFPVEDEHSDCCLVDFEGAHIALKSHQLEALTHAYSITVHKSQGSQFNRVIVPIRESRLLDQTLIYTAITRAVDQVVLVGNRRALEEAISAPASAAGRHVTLPELMSGRAQFGI